MKPKGNKKADPKTKKDKVSQQRLRTFNSSEFSLWDEKNQMQSSATDLAIFKNESIMKKRAVHSALSQYDQNSSTAKAAAGKSIGKKKKKKNNNLKNKETKSKSKLKQRVEEYEKIKYKDSHSQSQIVFSNDETKRQSLMGENNLGGNMYLHQLQQKHIREDSNLVLRVSIKREYARKVEAAIKIQKNFRGYLTRKILNKYIHDEIKSQSHHRRGQYSGRSMGEERSIGSTFRECDDFNSSMFENKKHFEAKHPESEESGQKEGLDSDEEFEKMKREAKEQEKYRGTQNEDSQSSEEEAGQIVYRHQNPIYSQDEISDFLQSSQDEEEWNDAYEPDIIFETNEEYLESRKSSLQNKSEPINRLSNKGIAEIMNLRKQSKQRNHFQQIEEAEAEQIKDNPIQKTLKYNQSHRLALENSKHEKTEKKNSGELSDKIKEEMQSSSSQGQGEKTLKSKDSIRESLKREQKQKDSSFELKNARNPDQVKPKSSDEKQEDKRDHRDISKTFEDLQLKNKTKFSGMTQMNMRLTPADLSKYLDQYENNSSSSSSIDGRNSQNQEQILRLRTEECQRWEAVIQMVNSQIKKNHDNNEEMMSFMKTIMEFSKKNKQLLGSGEINLDTYEHTTPTSMGTPIQQKEFMTAQYAEEDHDEDETPKKFFKKKQLKIEIVEEPEERSSSKKICESEIFQELRQSNSFKKSIEKPVPTFIPLEKEETQPLQKLSHKQFSKQSSLAFFEKKPSIEKRKKEQFESSSVIPREQSSTDKLKNIFSSSMMVQDEAINEILRLREELLQKRESQELMKLNELLSKGKLNQTSFIQSLENLTKKFSAQKMAIDKAKNDITKGYQAANDLVKNYFYDVRRMGIKLAVSRSQDNLKYKMSPRLLQNTDLLVDELTPKSTPKSIKQIFRNHEAQEVNFEKRESQEEDSEVQFTEEELKRFRKAANFNSELNELNGNLSIGDDFIRQQKGEFKEKKSPQKQSVFLFHNSPQSPQRREFFPQRETYHLSEEKLCSENMASEEAERVLESVFENLMWELATQLMIKPMMSQKFIDISHLIRPLAITDKERERFMTILCENLPDKESLHGKLNQKISPTPLQILKCMRLDFSEDDYDENEDECYEEISKYEFVINQETCVQSVMIFKNQIDWEERDRRNEAEEKVKTMVPLNDILARCPFKEKLQNFISQRERFLASRREHTSDLRWEILNIELHCIFDSWNEEIIKICSNKAGFSGIGVNELSLSMIDHNKHIPPEKTQQIMETSKQRVQSILNDDTEINAKILKENFEEMCEHDSVWILYADEALSYGLELLYLIEEEIYTEMARQLRRFDMKGAL